MTLSEDIKKQLSLYPVLAIAPSVEGIHEAFDVLQKATEILDGVPDTFLVSFDSLAIHLSFRFNEEAGERPELVYQCSVYVGYLRTVLGLPDIRSEDFWLDDIYDCDPDIREFARLDLPEDTSSYVMERDIEVLKDYFSYCLLVVMAEQAEK